MFNNFICCILSSLIFLSIGCKEPNGKFPIALSSLVCFDCKTIEEAIAFEGKLGSEMVTCNKGLKQKTYVFKRVPAFELLNAANYTLKEDDSLNLAAIFVDFSNKDDDFPKLCGSEAIDFNIETKITRPEMEHFYYGMKNQVVKKYGKAKNYSSTNEPCVFRTPYNCTYINSSWELKGSDIILSSIYNEIFLLNSLTIDIDKTGSTFLNDE